VTRPKLSGSRLLAATPHLHADPLFTPFPDGIFWRGIYLRARSIENLACSVRGTESLSVRVFVTLSVYLMLSRPRRYSASADNGAAPGAPALESEHDDGEQNAAARSRAHRRRLRVVPIATGGVLWLQVFPST